MPLYWNRYNDIPLVPETEAAVMECSEALSLIMGCRRDTEPNYKVFDAGFGVACLIAGSERALA